MDNNYLYAVANIRANELSLLSRADIDALIDAPDYKTALTLLDGKGYDTSFGSDYSAMLDGETEKTWSLIKSVAPSAEAFDIFIVKNDSQNLKAVLKSEKTGEDAEKYLVSPSVIPKELLLKAVKERDFDSLPDFISDAAEKCLEVITKTENGQLCDIAADRACLEAMSGFAKSADNDIVAAYGDIFIKSAVLKTAYRAILTNKKRGFLEEALPDIPEIKKADLIDASLQGADALYDFVSSLGLESFAEALKNSPSAFEKYCDDAVMENMKKAKYTAFGLGPIAAYIFARMTEIGCVRIILSAKFNGTSEETVRERMRELYVKNSRNGRPRQYLRLCVARAFRISRGRSAERFAQAQKACRGGLRRYLYNRGSRRAHFSGNRALQRQPSPGHNPNSRSRRQYGTRNERGKRICRASRRFRHR